MREHPVRRRRAGERAEPVRADAVLPREALQDGQVTLAVEGGVLLHPGVVDRGVVDQEASREAAHVGRPVEAAPADLRLHRPEAVARVGEEAVRRGAVFDRHRRG